MEISPSSAKRRQIDAVAPLIVPPNKRIAAMGELEPSPQERRH
jgi:hypothetical protein